MAGFPQSGEVWKEYREIKDRAEKLAKGANDLIQPSDLRTAMRKPEPSRGHAAITAAILSVGARIEALTYVIQRLDDRDKDRNP